MIDGRCENNSGGGRWRWRRTNFSLGRVANSSIVDRPREILMVTNSRTVVDKSIRNILSTVDVATKIRVFVFWSVRKKERERQIETCQREQWISHFRWISLGEFDIFYRYAMRRCARRFMSPAFLDNNLISERSVNFESVASIHA